MEFDSDGGDKTESQKPEAHRARVRETPVSTVVRAGVRSGQRAAAGSVPDNQATRLPRLAGLLDQAPRGAEPAVVDRNRRRSLENLLSYPPVPGVTSTSRDLVAARDTHSPHVRTLRFFAARLIRDAATSDNLCFSVAAPHRQAGATYLAANLAIVFSQIGLRTVLIDANLRAPRVHELFGCNNDRGVCDLRDGDRLESYPIQRLPFFRDLSVVTSGTLPADRRAAQINSSLDSMVGTLRRSFEVVICDAPAYARRGERACEAVASICGDSLLVLRKDRTAVRAARGLVKALEAARIHIVGSVLLEH